MIAPSLAHLAQLPLMKTYSTEELHKIQMFLRDGTISEGLEWMEKKDYGLRRRMKVHALMHGYGQALAHLPAIYLIQTRRYNMLIYMVRMNNVGLYYC